VFHTEDSPNIARFEVFTAVKVFTRATWRNIPEDAILHSPNIVQIPFALELFTLHIGDMQRIQELNLFLEDC
jgi:hypothetical protein